MSDASQPFGPDDVKRLCDWMGVRGNVVDQAGWNVMDNATRKLYVLSILKTVTGNYTWGSEPLREQA